MIALSSNPQEVPGSPVLQSLHSSPSVFRDEASAAELSLHENPPTNAKELSSSSIPKRDRFYISIGCQSPLAPVPSELDPSLRNLLGGTVSPAIGSSTPSPTHRQMTTLHSTTTDSPIIPTIPHIQRLHREGERPIASVGSTGSSTGAADLGMQSGASPEGADSLSEVVSTCACTYMLPKHCIKACCPLVPVLVVNKDICEDDLYVHTNAS